MSKVTLRLVAFFVVMILFIFFVQFAYAQTVAVVEPLPEDITTWGGLFGYWVPKIITGALAVVGTVLALALRQLIAMAPTVVQTYVDTKRQRDLHSAVMSKVGELMTEGRWPTASDFRAVAGDMTSALKPQLIEEIREYVVRYNPQAAEWADLVMKSPKADKLLKTLSLRKSIELAGDPLADALNQIGLPAQPVPGVYLKP